MNHSGQPMTRHLVVCGLGILALVVGAAVLGFDAAPLAALGALFVLSTN